MADLKVLLYVDLSSQPARAITAFCKLNNIAHEVKPINMGKKEHMKEPYISIAPSMKIPAA